MRVFIALCLIFAVKGDKLAYNYQPVGHSDSGLSFNPGNPSNPAPAASLPSTEYIPPIASASAQSFNSAPVSVPTSQSSPGVPHSTGFNSAAATENAPSFSAPVRPVDKEFYTFSANDADFIDTAASQQVNNLAKQHLQVIFVKGPESSGLEDAAAALAKQSSDRKTAIYVLNKQPDVADLANRLNQAGDHTNSKPEVHFVKYRTPQDAENAQRQIQSQYDSLVGPSHSYNEGIAPSIDFSSNPAVKPQEAASAPFPQATYLPPNIFKSLRF